MRRSAARAARERALGRPGHHRPLGAKHEQGVAVLRRGRFPVRCCGVRALGRAERKDQVVVLDQPGRSPVDHAGGRGGEYPDWPGSHASSRSRGTGHRACLLELDIEQGTAEDLAPDREALVRGKIVGREPGNARLATSRAIPRSDIGRSGPGAGSRRAEKIISALFAPVHSIVAPVRAVPADVRYVRAARPDSLAAGIQEEEAMIGFSACADCCALHSSLRAPAGAAEPAGKFTPACATRDLRAIAFIERHGEAGDIPSAVLAEAGLAHLQARLNCLLGNEASRSPCTTASSAWRSSLRSGTED